VSPLILTYHAVESGHAPLCIEPVLFAAHVDVIAESGVRVMTIRELGAALASGALETDAVAITFDDGFVSVVETAAPLLEARGLAATLFCVAGHLGGTNDWPSALKGDYRSRLAGVLTLRELAANGFEIGSHGTDHTPLAGASEAVLRRELVDSRSFLEETLETPVSSYAYPYGALPGPPGRRLVEGTYDAACTTSLRRVSKGSELCALPRIDAHYIRRPDQLKRALEGRLGGYFRARGLIARARRTMAKDYTAERRHQGLAG